MIRSSIRRPGMSPLQTAMILAIAAMILLAIQGPSRTATDLASSRVDDLTSATVDDSRSDFAKPVLEGGDGTAGKPVDGDHGENTAETWSRLAKGENHAKSKTIRDALSNAKSSIQEGGYGSINYDEYKFTIDKMPPGMTPDQLLNAFAKNPNQLVDNDAFDFVGKFHPRFENRDAEIGDIFDIDIPGNIPGRKYLPRNNGSVMIVNKTKNSFDVATLTTPETGDHPVTGTRSFGYQINPDQSITFYTRGRDQDAIFLGDWNGVRTRSQAALWGGAMKGISTKIDELGGKSRPGSFEHDLKLTDGGVPTPKTSNAGSRTSP